MPHPEPNPLPLTLVDRYGFYLLCFLVIICYLPELSGPFYSDDQVYILNNSLITALPLEQLWRLFTPIHHIEFLPIRDLSFYLDYKLFGDNPLGYKIHNLLIYLLLGLATLLATRTLLKLTPTKDTTNTNRFALLVTALFLLHPTHVESVSWIASRKDLLCALFSFLSLWQFNEALLAETNKQKLHHLLFAWLLMLTALFSKSVALPIVGVFFLLTVIHLHNIHKLIGALLRASLINAPFIVTALLVMHLHIQVGIKNNISITDESLQGLTTFDYLHTSLQILGNLSQISLWPIGLRIHYNHQPAVTIELLRLTLALIVVITSLWALWRLAKKYSLAAFAILFFLLLNLPYLQLIPFNTWSLASERFLVISVYGFCLLLALLLLRLPQRWTPYLISIVLIFYALQSGLRADDWSSETQLAQSNWQADEHYIYPVWHRLKTNELLRQQWQQSQQLIEGVQPEIFHPVLEQLIHFYARLADTDSHLQSQHATQALLAAEATFMAIDRTKMDLGERYLYDLIGDLIRAGYNNFLNQHNNNAYMHYRAAQFIGHTTPTLRSEIINHLEMALMNQGLNTPQHIDALRLLAQQKRISGDLIQAEVLLSRALHIDNNDHHTHLAMAQLQHQLGNQELLRRFAHNYRRLARIAGVSKQEINNTLKALDIQP